MSIAFADRASMRWLAAAVVFCSLSFGSFAQAGSWGERGVSRKFLVEGNRLYSADGRGVTVYDVSDSASPRVIDVETGDDESLDLARTGVTLVLATRGGVDSFAMAEDGSLSRRGHWKHEGGVTRIAANAKWTAAALNREIFLLAPDGEALAQQRVVAFGNRVLAMTFTTTHLFAAVESEGIHVVDPESGSVVAIVSQASESLALSGSTLWSAAKAGGLVAIDVRDPLSPRTLSATAVGTIPMDGVAAAGSRVVVFRSPNIVHVFDATNVAEPRLAATVTEWVDVIGVSGNRFFVSGPRLDRDRFTYESGTPLRVFDATDPATPHLAGEVHDLAGPVSGVWTDGSLAYVVDAPFFRVLDVSRTAEPRELGAIPLPFAAPQLRVRVKNGIALVYGRDYVHLIDVSDPVRPRFLVTWDPRGHSPDDAALMADGLFVELNDHSGIHVVNYVDYNPPAQVGGRISHWHSVAAGDDAIYALASGYLLTMSLTNGTKVQDTDVIAEVGLRLDTAPPNADRPPILVMVQGSGIRMFSLVEDRFHPRQFAFVPVSEPGQMATSSESLIVDVGGTLHRLEFSRPAELLPTDMRVTSAMQISMAGEKVVVADRYRVRVYGPDTPPPPSPATSKRRSVRP